MDEKMSKLLETGWRARTRAQCREEQGSPSSSFVILNETIENEVTTAPETETPKQDTIRDTTTWATKAVWTPSSQSAKKRRQSTRARPKKQPIKKQRKSAPVRPKRQAAKKQRQLVLEQAAEEQMELVPVDTENRVATKWRQSARVHKEKPLSAKLNHDVPDQEDTRTGIRVTRASRSRNKVAKRASMTLPEEEASRLRK